ncbi:site-specific DNA-methyltransferase [Nostoc sp. CHAB 5836]|uniref:DNA methyltransferase n=1 Tax=Nostoc sp. CHAB 5836 TaxID=2780404 RepID=UPI001E341A0D|nr:DNA methyltransferase [Nostoc sp. CHAB 5836]MCC5619258.1 site-specific DNA-methyltransferase [Nostoc sp. CHAB 5836]
MSLSISSEISTVSDQNQSTPNLGEWRNKIILGDCLDNLKAMPSNIVDLIVTSPPYADSRKNTYGGVHPDKYVEWFLPISQELKRVLKDDGTFILNIKERVFMKNNQIAWVKLIDYVSKRGKVELDNSIQTSLF